MDFFPSREKTALFVSLRGLKFFGSAKPLELSCHQRIPRLWHNLWGRQKVRVQLLPEGEVGK